MIADQAFYGDKPILEFSSVHLIFIIIGMLLSPVDGTSIIQPEKR